MLGNLDTNFAHIGISGFGNSSILSGRPYGGCAILWRSDLSAQVQVFHTKSTRVCAVRLITDICRLLLICVYMPYVSMSEDFADQLAMIDSVIQNNSDCHFVVAGDYDVNLSRNSVHTAMLCSYCDNAGLTPVVKHINANIDYTYHFGMWRFSVLDQFLLSGTLFGNAVSSVSVVHDIDITSDHEPVVMNLSLQMRFLACADRVHKPGIKQALAT